MPTVFSLVRPSEPIICLSGSSLRFLLMSMNVRCPGCAGQQDGDERTGPEDQTYYQLRRSLPPLLVAGGGSLCREWNPLPGRVSNSIGVVTTCSDLCRTGETPWVKLMIEKYHETAKSNGAIVS